MLCFRCILPSCYKDIDSDDEEGKDEGYHSQNRGSSEVPTSFPGPGTSTQGAASTSDNAVEMTEIKTEAVSLIPPPRLINDYRKDPCSRQASSSSNDSKTNQKTTGEITYIEVESVPVSKENKLEAENDTTKENIPEDEESDIAVSHNKNSEEDEELSGTGKAGHDELKNKVMTNSDSPETDKKFVDTEHKESENEGSKLDPSEYVDCDNIPGKQQYFNLNSTNMPKAELIKSTEHDYVNDKQLSSPEKIVDYANVNDVDTDFNATKTKQDYDFTASEEPHDYMNLSELEKKKVSNNQESESVRTEISKLVKVTKNTKKKSDLDENSIEDSIENLKKQCIETLEKEMDGKIVPESKENNASYQKPNEDFKIDEQPSGEKTMEETTLEGLTVRENTESDAEHESDKTHLVNVGDRGKLLGKQSKKDKLTDKSSDESDDDSNGKKVTDQTKLI